MADFAARGQPVKGVCRSQGCFRRVGVRIADIVARLTCSCTSQRIAVGPRYNRLTEADRQAPAAAAAP